MSTFVSYYYILDIFPMNMDLSLLTLGGLLINFKDRKYQVAYQVFVFGLLMAARYDALPALIKQYLPLPVGLVQ